MAARTCALMKLSVALFVAILATVPLPGRSDVAADAIPDSATLRARSDVAYGPVPENSRETVESSGTSGSGKRVICRRGPDRREISDAGTIHTERGIYKGDHWHENANGHVVIDQDDPGLATHETMTTTVTRVSAPLDAYVIATLNSKGFGTRDYIDPKTYFVVRRESLAPNGKAVTTYDDFRAFGTRHLAAHWTTHDETTATDRDYELREYSAGSVADSDVAMPNNRRLLVEYPAGQDRVVLPSTFEPDGHVLVRLTVGGRGLDFLFDTGASSITIDPGVAASLGLTVVDKMQSSANAGRFATGLAVVPEMHVGALAMHDTVVNIVPLGWELPGAKAVGLLGFDFICESGITIDYDHQTVTAERFGTYTAPADPKAIALDLRLTSQQAVTSVNINGAVAERMLLDTGGSGAFMLFDYFIRRNPGALPPQHPTDQTVRMNGAGGGFDVKTVVLDKVQLGNVMFTHFEGYRVTSASSYSNEEDGLIGPTFLRFFDLHVDYPNGRLYLVPNAMGHRFMH